MFPTFDEDCVIRDRFEIDTSFETVLSFAEFSGATRLHRGASAGTPGYTAGEKDATP